METRVEKKVGQRLRHVRETRGLSLRALAQRCAMSANAISLIEHGENSPTVASLHRLAEALDASIADFFRDAEERTAVYVPRSQRMSVEGDGITLQSLGIGLKHQKLEPFMITVAPHATTNDQPVSHPGEEFVLCTDGRCVYRVGEHEYTLGSGDSLLFDATNPHYFSNREDEPATLIVVFQSTENVMMARQAHFQHSFETPE